MALANIAHLIRDADREREFYERLEERVEALYLSWEIMELSAFEKVALRLFADELRAELQRLRSRHD